MLILASSSPRRQLLISRLGIDVICEPSTVDESLLSAAGTAGDFVVRAAVAKAVDVARARPGAVVIGCDTVVVHADRRLGKPRDRADAESTLRSMAGDLVEIKTGLAVVVAGPGDGYQDTALVSDTCQMAPIDDVVLGRYLASGVWHDKAGSLAVQHQDPTLIEAFGGCVPNVLGLPLCDLATMLLAAPLSAEEWATLSAFGCRLDQSACEVSIATLAGT